MSWAESHDFVTGEFMLSALLQTYIHNNIIETAPAKAVAAGDIFYADAPHHLQRLPMETADALKSLALGPDGVTPMWKGSAFKQQPVFNTGTGNTGTSVADMVSQAITVAAGSDVLIIASGQQKEAKSSGTGNAVHHRFSLYRDSTLLYEDDMQQRALNGASIPCTSLWFGVWLDVNPGAGTYAYKVRGYYTAAATTGTPTYAAEIAAFEV